MGSVIRKAALAQQVDAAPIGLEAVSFRLLATGTTSGQGLWGWGMTVYGDFVNSFYYFGLQHLLRRAGGYFAARFQQQDAIGVLGR